MKLSLPEFSICVFVNFACFSTLQAQESTNSCLPRGPLPTRKYFPTDLLFLGYSMDRPSVFHAKKFSWKIRYTQSNSFVKSGSILESLPSEDSRLVFNRTLAEMLVQRDPAGDAYFFDVEIPRIAVSFQYRLSKRIQAGLELPVLRFSGGLMDGVIEAFHSTFGISDDERPDFKQNTAQAFVYLGGNFWHRSERDLQGPGPGDVILSAKYLFNEEGNDSPALAIKFGMKLPAGQYQKMHGSGSADFGVSLLASKSLARNTLYLTFDAIFPGEWRVLPNFDLARFYVLQFAYERLLGKNLSLLLQANSNSNPFRGKTETGLSGLSHELTLGIKLDISQKLVWFAAVTENYAYFRNSPDLGFSIGIETK
jgi:hypothetical protein